MSDLPTGPSQEANYVTNRAKEDARRAEDKRIEVSILARLEPDCNGVNAVSSAISMKRIADCLERMELRTNSQTLAGYDKALFKAQIEKALP